MRFLHIADVHLDAPFATRADAVRDRLRAASREALRGAFDLAIRERAHAVLVAGDLFDGERLSFESEAFLVRELSRLGEEGVAVVYATGNHDPGRSGLRSVARPWPANVTVVAERTPRRVPVHGPGGEVVGHVTAAGHESPRETADLAATFPRPPGAGADEGGPEVALLHTQVHGARDAEEHHAYAPSELSGLQRAGFHYWALGHVHRPQALCESPAVRYAGSLQGRTSAETGPRGGLLVDLAEPRRPRVTFHPLAPVRWETVTVGGLDRIGTLEALVRRVRDAWEDERERDPAPGCDGWIVRIVLEGPAALWKELRLDDDVRHLAAELTEALGALDVEVRTGAVHPPLDVHAHRGRGDVLGEALRMVSDVRAGREALERLGPGDLAATEADPELDVGAYVRELLQGAEAEVLARMLHADALESAVARWIEGGPAQRSLPLDEEG